MGIEVLPPDVNESNMFFTVVGPNIRFGLGAVKGVGESAIESILEARRARRPLHVAAGVLRGGRPPRLQQEGDRGADQVGLVRFPRHDAQGDVRVARVDRRFARSGRKKRRSGDRARCSASVEGRHSCSVPGSAAQARVSVLQAEWPDEEKLRYEKETLGFYITGHPLNKYADELKHFANGVNTETLYRFVDETVNIGGIVSQIKRSKIKKGPNEGKMMAKFVLDDQFGSVDVVVFSDLYAKYAKWLDNGVAVLRHGEREGHGRACRPAGARRCSRPSRTRSTSTTSTAAIPRPRGRGCRRTSERRGGGGRSRSEGDRARKVRRTRQGQLLAVRLPRRRRRRRDVPRRRSRRSAELRRLTPRRFHEAPITPELNALEIVPLDGIRDKKVKEIALEVRTPT